MDSITITVLSNIFTNTIQFLLHLNSRKNSRKETIDLCRRQVHKNIRIIQSFFYIPLSKDKLDIIVSGENERNLVDSLHELDYYVKDPEIQQIVLQIRQIFEDLRDFPDMQKASMLFSLSKKILADYC